MHHEETFWTNPRTWVGVAFVLFIVIFGKKLWDAMKGMLDSHSDRIRAELDEASRLRTEAEAMLKDAQARREAALADAQKLLEGAKAEAARVQEGAAADAEASAKRREQMAIDRIAAAEKAAVDDVRLTAADIATTAARDVIAKTLTPDADAGLIDQAITQMPSALSAKRAA